MSKFKLSSKSWTDNIDIDIRYGFLVTLFEAYRQHKHELCYLKIHEVNDRGLSNNAHVFDKLVHDKNDMVGFHVFRFLDNICRR